MTSLRVHNYADYEGYAAWKDWGEDSFAVGSSPMGRYFEAELGRHGFSCHGRRILEVGFGQGEFLRYARDRGAEVIGVEVQGELVRRATAAGFTAYGSLAEALEKSGKNRFDLILAFDVFEHLSPEEAIAMLKTLREMVDLERGMLIARFPNGDSPFSVVLQNGDYTHRMWIGHGIATQLLARSGWTKKYLGEPTWVADAWLDRLFLALKNNMRWVFEWMLRLFYYSRSSPSTFYPNYILVAVPARPGE